jgi:hypothetical protein
MLGSYDIFICVIINAGHGAAGNSIYTDLHSRWTTQPSAGYPGGQRGDDAGVLGCTPRKAIAVAKHPGRKHPVRTQRQRRYTLEGESVLACAASSRRGYCTCRMRRYMWNVSAGSRPTNVLWHLPFRNDAGKSQRLLIGGMKEILRRDVPRRIISKSGLLKVMFSSFATFHFLTPGLSKH